MVRECVMRVILIRLRARVSVFEYLVLCSNIINEKELVMIGVTLPQIRLRILRLITSAFIKKIKLFHLLTGRNGNDKPPSDWNCWRKLATMQLFNGSMVEPHMAVGGTGGRRGSAGAEDPLGAQGVLQVLPICIIDKRRQRPRQSPYKNHCLTGNLNQIYIKNIIF